MTPGTGGPPLVRAPRPRIAPESDHAARPQGRRPAFRLRARPHRQADAHARRARARHPRVGAVLDRPRQRGLPASTASRSPPTTPRWSGGRGRGVPGHQRQGVHRHARWLRHLRHRPPPPQGAQGRARPAREAGHPLAGADRPAAHLPRQAGGADHARATCSTRSSPTRAPSRSRAASRWRCSPPAARKLRRHHRRLPRQDPGRAGRHLQGVLPRALPAAAQLVARAVRRRRRAGHAAQGGDFTGDRVAAVVHRADPGRGRHQRGAAGLPGKAARELCDEYGAMLVFDEVQSRHGAHRQDVRLRARRRHAGPDGAGQGLRRRRHAHRRRAWARRRPGRSTSRTRSCTPPPSAAIRWPASAAIATINVLLEEDLPRAGAREGRVPAQAHERARRAATRRS